jgi:hypothetical protein
MDVFLNTPAEMVDNGLEGLSLWLYRLVRDAHRLNDPPRRLAFDQIEAHRFPARLHYLTTPIVTPREPQDGPALEQLIIGVVLQSFADRPLLHGPDLEAEFTGTDTELRIHFEPLDLEEITRIWDAQNESYQLCLSYEVTLVRIASRDLPREAAPVASVEATYGTTVLDEAES